MARSSNRTVAVLIAIAMTVGLGGSAVLAQGRLSFLTPGEAAQLRLGPSDAVPVPHLRGVPPGPRIVVHEPTVTRTADGAVIETTPVTRFVISFEPNRAPVDMDSLEIKARKGLFSLSLTSRLKPYVQGTSLQADSVSIPEGRFMVQIEIVDRAGAKTMETYRLDVKAGDRRG
jgi:hypothetical protein